MNYEKLGQQLRLARERSQMTQTEAAQLIEVTPSALNQYESGKRRVDALTVERLARLYGVPIRYIFEAEIPSRDWEDALRLGSQNISPSSKAGIARLIEKVSALEELYKRRGIPFPGIPHSPFPPVPDDRLADAQTAIASAQKARSHYHLGIAPLLDLRGFLESRTYHIFMLPFGQEANAIRGLFFLHPNLGYTAVLNEELSRSDRHLTLAHLFAHSLYQNHWPATFCRQNDTRSLETFANRFAAYFLIPSEALIERLQARQIKAVANPADAIHLARYFGVSYETMLYRLKEESCLSGSPERWNKVQPEVLAQMLGYSPKLNESDRQFMTIEDRLPRIFIELTYRAVASEKLSLGSAAEILGISEFELEDRLYFEDSEERVAETHKILQV